MSGRKTETIELCDSCKGTGVIEREELVNHHKGDYDYWTETCSRCLGSGLIKVTETYTMTVEPYLPETARPRKNK